MGLQTAVREVFGGKVRGPTVTMLANEAYDFGWHIKEGERIVMLPKLEPKQTNRQASQWTSVSNCNERGFGGI